MMVAPSTGWMLWALLGFGASSCAPQTIDSGSGWKKSDAKSNPTLGPVTTTAAASASVAAAPSASAAPPPPDAGSTRIALKQGRSLLLDGDDHVTIFAADGHVVAESSCGFNGISYRRAATFLHELTRLVEANDPNGLADLMAFPLRASTIVESREQFIAGYARIIPPEQAAAITQADPDEVFCRRGAFMLGDGLIWAEPDRSGNYKVTTINRPMPGRGGG